MIPRYCDMGGAPGQTGNDCGVDPFSILPNRSGYVDQQQLKLQVCAQLCSSLGAVVGFTYLHQKLLRAAAEGASQPCAHHFVCIGGELLLRGTQYHLE